MSTLTSYKICTETLIKSVESEVKAEKEDWRMRGRGFMLTYNKKDWSLSPTELLAKKKGFRKKRKKPEKNWKKFEKCFNIFQFFSNLASSPTIHCLPSTVAKNNLPNQYGVCMCRRRWTVTNSTKDVRKQFIQRGDDDGVDSLRENRLFFESWAIRASCSRSFVNTIRTMRPHS